MRTFVLAALFGLAAGCLAAAQGATLSVDQLVAAGEQGNLDLLKARRDLSEAAKGLRWESELANTKASLSGSYGTTGALSGQAQVTVPIIPQVSLGASVNSDGRASASVSLSPFAAWRASYLERATYRKAELQLAYQTAKLRYDIESAAYGVLQARANLAVAQASLALEEDRAEIARQTYELGELSYDDLQVARSKLTAARQAGFDAERSLLNARVQLYRLLGPAAGEPRVAEVDTEKLLVAIAARDTELVGKDAASAGSLALRQGEITLDSLKEQLAATPVYRPNLGLSGQLAYAGPGLSGSGSLSFSFSPSELKVDERDSISQSIVSTQRDIELERLALRLQASILAQALASARQVLQTRQTELEQAQTTLAEDRLLLEQGQRTSLEVERSRIDLDAAIMRRFQAAAGVLDAQAEILLSYSL